MFFVKVNHLVTQHGNYDYKGLRESGYIVAGTQVYPYNIHTNNYCLLGVRKVIEHQDVILLTEEQYLKEKKQIEDAQPVIETEASKMERLEAENAELKIAMAELAEQQMLADAETKLAMAELAEAMMGGVK